MFSLPVLRKSLPSKSARPPSRGLVLERLEDRLALSADVHLFVTSINNDLTLGDSVQHNQAREQKVGVFDIDLNTQAMTQLVPASDGAYPVWQPAAIFPDPNSSDGAFYSPTSGGHVTRFMATLEPMSSAILTPMDLTK
jgi:hypothetical protein